MKITFKKLMVLFFCFIFIIGVYYIVTIFEEHASKKVVSNVNDIINIEDTETALSINKVKELQNYYGNSDIKAILSIEGIDEFNYPVTQSTDNDYYLNHDYYKKYDAYGAIYADYRSDLNNSKKKLIFGHSSSKINVPFNYLENYEDKAFYEKHKYITLETETNSYRYEIFSVYVETTDFSYMNMNFDNKGSWYAHIVGMQKKSLYQTDVVLDMDDDILILQTCSKNSSYDDYSKKYLLIVSRRVK